MSLERDGELRAQLNLQAASLSARISVCGLYMFVCTLTIVCCVWLAFSALAPSLAIIVLGVETHLQTKWAKTNHEVRVCTHSI